MDTEKSIEKTKENLTKIPKGSPQQLLSIALSNNANIETLERLMDLQERYDKKNAEKAFYRAFTKFQAELPNIQKTKRVKFELKTGGWVNYNYAPLDYIRRAIQKPLKKNGFSYRWEFEDRGDKIFCRCILTHINGHSETSTIEAGKDTSGKKNEIQQIGSTRTYLQRYTLIGVLGLTTVEDDTDGMMKDLRSQLIDEIAELKTQNKLSDAKAALRDKYVKLGMDRKLATTIIQDALMPVDKTTEIYNNTVILINEFTSADELYKKFPNILQRAKEKLNKQMVLEIEKLFQAKFNELNGGKNGL